MEILGKLYHARAARRVAAVIAVFAVSAVYAWIAFGAAGWALAGELPLPTFQSSPVPTPEWVPSVYIYAPLINQNAGESGEHTYYPPDDTPIVLSCADDACRGDLYRNWVSNTIVILNPLAGWASSGCSCGLLDARARGAAIGTIVGMGVKIVGSIFSTMGTVVGQALGLLFQFWELATSDADTYSVSCESDMELFCFGLAAIVALDAVGGGIVMALTLLLVSVASVYLILWVVKEVREIMQPGSGGD